MSFARKLPPRLQYAYFQVNHKKKTSFINLLQGCRSYHQKSIISPLPAPILSPISLSLLSQSRPFSSSFYRSSSPSTSSPSSDADHGQSEPSFLMPGLHPPQVDSSFKDMLMMHCVEVDENGHCKSLDVDKYDLLDDYGLEKRDVRQFDQSYSPFGKGAFILPRDRAILVKLHDVKLLVTAHRVLVFDTFVPSNKELLDELSMRLSGEHEVRPVDFTEAAAPLPPSPSSSSSFASRITSYLTTPSSSSSTSNPATVTPDSPSISPIAISSTPSPSTSTSPASSASSSSSSPASATSLPAEAWLDENDPIYGSYLTSSAGTTSSSTSSPSPTPLSGTNSRLTEVNSLGSAPHSGVLVGNSSTLRDTSVPTITNSFEFRVIEYTLEYVCTHFHQRFEHMQKDTEKMLNELGSNPNFSPSRLMTAKNQLSSFEVRLKELMAAIQEILNSDHDMATMYLSYTAATGFRRRTEEHQELEMLLENYLRNVSLMLNYVKILAAKVDSGEESLRIELDRARNEMMRMELRMTVVTASAACGAFLSALFGMNLTSGLEHTAYGFFLVSTLGVGISGVMYGFIRRQCMRRKIWS